MQQVDFERLFQKLPSPHMVLDRDMNFVAVNPAYEAATLRDSRELIGRNLFEMFPNDGESGRRLRASIGKVFQTGESDTLAFIRYEIPLPGTQGGVEERYWTAVHTPVSDDAGAVRFLVQNTVDVTEMVRMREAMSLPIRANIGELQLIERAREAEDANRELEAQGADFRRLFQGAPQMIAVLTGPDHRFTFVNDAYRRFIGGRDVLRVPVRDAVPEVEGQGFFDLLDDVYRNAREHSGEGARVLFRQDATEEPREAFMDFSYRPIRDGKGDVSGVFVQGMDRTEAVRDGRRQRLLLDELNHRVKNTLATVQSIASQTLRSARDLSSARRDIEARIMALSKAHNLLSARRWSSLKLDTIVRQELAPYGADRVSVAGPEVMIDSKSAIAVAMLMHELGSNAVQHGSLSVPQGRLDVAWRTSGSPGDARLLFEWRESGGPAVVKPERQGFGTRMLERVAVGELGGRLAADYAPDGFSCRLDIPAANLVKVNNDALHS